MINKIYSTFEDVLFFYFAYSTLYSLFLAVAALFKSRFQQAKKNNANSFCILIPAYKEDEVILDSVQNTLEQNYSSSNFDVFVIADSLRADTLQKLQQTKAHVLEVQFERSTKVKALNTALALVKDEYSAAVILDADNFIGEDFLAKAIDLLNAGYQSIQGQRMPKNTDSKLAFLDGLSEAINNRIFRKGSYNLGLSSSISGSGYVAEFGLLKEALSDMDAVSGFDKELEIKLLQKGVKTIYCENLEVLDEKVSNQKDFKNQRRRWIYSQFYYLSKYFNVSVKALFSLKIALWNSAFLRHAQLPRFLNIGLLFFSTVLFTITNWMQGKLAFAWWVVLALNIFSILIAIPARFYTRQLFESMLQLPVTFLTMFLLLFKLKGTNESFIHTPHGKSDNKPLN